MAYDTPYDITKVSFESDYPDRQIQENRLQYCMGRITKLGNDITDCEILRLWTLTQVVPTHFLILKFFVHYI